LQGKRTNDIEKLNKVFQKMIEEIYPMKFYAHSTESVDTSDWQPLDDHLNNVAELSEKFTSAFGADEWGRCGGLLHDAGKATEAFQQRLEGSPQKVDHSTFGARLAQKYGGRLGVLLAYAVAGHHGGLANGGEQKGQLHYRLKHGTVPEDAHMLPCFQCDHVLKVPFSLTRGRAGFSLSFFTRMIFSSLVDADFLDTEKFYSPDKTKERQYYSGQNDLPRLWNLFHAHMAELVKNADQTQVNILRKEIYRQCVEKAEMPRQVFSLTVPTGGGKTLSSMAFALRHANNHGMKRVIYAIPFTSIIEQNAGIFKKIFGWGKVLEHHSNFIEKDDQGEQMLHLRHRLAVENWDAPIVVTTNIQFFESLFACKTSRCRKLHNIAGSVIILDEAQAIPTEYLRPCLAALGELIDHYGCSVILCTATQPALDDESTLKKEALHDTYEIVPNPDTLFRKLKRVQVDFVGKKSDEQLAALLKKEEQVLCIVSTKPQARTIFELLCDLDGVFHLSTNMYPLHRQKVLREIRKRLKAGQTCRVVSTSLVEAGVDLDFPVVYRAMAGLDSIAQAAGRCNREGHLNDQGLLGRVYVFESEKLPSMPWLKRCITRAGEALRALPDKDPIGLETMRRYFELLYDVEPLDGKEIMQQLNPSFLDQDLVFPFREVAEKFRFIEEDSVGVIISMDPETHSLVQELRNTEYTQSTLRKLQPYTVSVRSNDVQTLHEKGALEIINDSIPLLCNPASYDQKTGLSIDKAGTWDIEQLIFD